MICSSETLSLTQLTTLQTLKKTTTILLTISFEYSFPLLPSNLTQLPLEDEHERRTVHTTKMPKHRENTELYSDHYYKSLKIQ